MMRMLHQVFMLVKLVVIYEGLITGTSWQVTGFASSELPYYWRIVAVSFGGKTSSNVVGSFTSSFLIFFLS